MLTPLSNLGWADLVDVFFLSVVAYYLFIWFKGTKALRAFIGLVVLGACYSLAQVWGLFLTTWSFQILWQVLVILILILFQNEIRQVLERVSPLKSFRRKLGTETRATLGSVAAAMKRVAKRGWGALVVIQRGGPLVQLTNEGLPLDGEVTTELLVSLFNPTSPTHDGAVVIDQERIARTGVVLPLSDRADLDAGYGTRHRAGLGISEVCDAVAIIVSEETGRFSLAVDGRIRTLSGLESMERELFELMSPQRKKRTFLDFLRDLVLKNWPFKIGAFVLVSLTWLVLAGQQNFEVALEAPVKYFGKDPGMEVNELSDKVVHLRLVGPRRLASSLTNDDVRVVVNLYGRGPGSHQITIVRQYIRVPLELEVVGVSPKILNVILKKELGP